MKLVLPSVPPVDLTRELDEPEVWLAGVAAVAVVASDGALVRCTGGDRVISWRRHCETLPRTSDTNVRACARYSGGGKSQGLAKDIHE